jgi:hypothetical protein
MSYKRKNYRLTWPEGHVRHGLVVSMRGMSIDDMNTVTAFKGISKDDVEQSAELLSSIAELLADKMISWNLTEDDDTPVPVSIEAIRREDLTMIMEILNAWTDAAVGVKASLGKDSNSGSTFPEESIPMETS